MWSNFNEVWVICNVCCNNYMQLSTTQCTFTLTHSLPPPVPACGCRHGQLSRCSRKTLPAPPQNTSLSPNGHRRWSCTLLYRGVGLGERWLCLWEVLLSKERKSKWRREGKQYWWQRNVRGNVFVKGGGGKPVMVKKKDGEIKNVFAWRRGVDCVHDWCHKGFN